MKLYLVRHGQTDWNLQGKLQGGTDIPLNENGKNAAIELGKKLKDIHFDKIYSSPLMRAYETATLICGKRNIPIIKDKRLCEISFGNGEGSSWKDWHKDENPYSSFFFNPGNYLPPPNGETLEHVMNRTKDFIQKVIEVQYSQAERVMVVAHGALNCALMCYLENNTKENFWGKGLPANCQAIIFEYDGKKWQRQN